MRNPAPLITLAAACLSAHCATTEPYPEHWSHPAAIEAGECAEISGTFSNVCSSTSESDRHCLESGGLAGLLFAKYAGSFHTKLGSADRVVISQPLPSRLQVQAWKGKQLLGEREVQLDPEDCTPEGIRIGSGLEGTQIEGGIGTGSSRAILRQTEDGDLLAQLKVHFTGLWFIVPVSGSSQDWLRFDRLSSDEIRTLTGD